MVSSYGPPDVSNIIQSFDPVGGYFGAAEQRRKKDVADVFKGGLPMTTDEGGKQIVDFRTAADMLARAGSPESVIPFSREPYIQSTLGTGAAKSAFELGQMKAAGEPTELSPPGAGAPRPATPTVPPRPAASAAPRASTYQPALAATGGDVGSGEAPQTLQSLVTELSGGREVGPLMSRFAQGFGVGLGDPLTPAQVAQFTPLIGQALRASSSAGAQQPPATSAMAFAPPGAGQPDAFGTRFDASFPHGAGAQQPQGAQPQEPAPQEPVQVAQAQPAPPAASRVQPPQPPQPAAPARPAVPPELMPRGFTDPVEAIRALRGAADNLLARAGTHGAARASQYIAQANEIEKYLGGPEEFKSIKDSFGNDVQVWVNPRTGTMRPAEITGSPSNSLANIASMEELAKVDPARYNAVKAYVEGRSIPVGNARSPQVQMTKRLAEQLVPGFDETVYKTRNETRRNFGSGTAAKNVTSLNTLMGHLNDLVETSSNLGQWGFTPFNTAENEIKSKFGDNALKEYRLSKQAVADEMGKVFRSSGMSEAETERWLQTFDESSSPKQFKAVIGRALKLLDSRMSALSSEYNKGMSLGPEGIGGLGKHTIDAIDDEGNHTRVPVSETGLKPSDLLNSDAKDKVLRIKVWLNPNAPRGGPLEPKAGGWSVKEIK